MNSVPNKIRLALRVAPYRRLHIHWKKCPTVSRNIANYSVFAVLHLCIKQDSTFLLQVLFALRVRACVCACVTHAAGKQWRPVLRLLEQLWGWSALLGRLLLRPDQHDNHWIRGHITADGAWKSFHRRVRRSCPGSYTVCFCNLCA